MGLIFNGNGDVIKAVDGSLTVEGLDLGGSTNIEAGIGTFSGNLNVGGVLTYEDVKNVDSVGIVTARAGVNLTGGNITLGDSSDGSSDDVLKFGAGSDLQLHSDGTNGVLRQNNNSGGLYIQADNFVQIGKVNAGSPIYGKFIKDGAVELYHNGSKKFETSSLGISVTGQIHATSTVKVGDSVEFIAGDGNDLKLYHNSTDSYITNATGDLWIQGNGDDILMRAADDINIYTQTSDKAIICIGDGGVELYHNDVKKLATTSGGIEVQDRVYVTGAEGAEAKVIFQADEGDDNADTWKIEADTSGSLNISNYASGSYERNIACAGNGNVELFHDNSKKLETTANGLNIHEDTDKVISFSGSIGEIGNVPGFQGSNTAGSSLTSLGMRATDLRFATGSAERLRITSTGEMGLGITTPPTGSFHIHLTETPELNLFSTQHAQNNTCKFNFGVGQSASVSGNTGARIEMNIPNSGGQMTGELKFHTNQGDNLIERLRIQSDGTVRFYNSIYGGDNKPIYLGNSNDLTLFHDSGGTSVIRYNHSVGGLHFRNNSNADQMAITSGGTLTLGSSGHNLSQVGGEEITGQDYDAILKIYSATASRWLMQGRSDTSTNPNGIFIRSGNTSSNYSLYTCGIDEAKTHLTVNGKGAVGIGTDEPGQKEVPGLHITTSSNDDCRVAFQTPTKPNSRIGYYGLSNRFGMDVYNGFEIRDAGNSYATRMLINSSGYVTKPAHPTFCARYTSGNGFSGDILVLTKVDDNYLTWNNGGHYSTSTGKFTAPVAGFYYFEGQVMATGFSNGTNIQDMVQIRSNQGLVSHPRQRRTYFRTEDDANGYYTNSASGQVKLAANDTVWFQRNGGGSWSYSNTNYTYFTGWLIG